MSVEGYALRRQDRKIAHAPPDMPAEKIRRIADNRMDPEHAHLDALMDD